MLNVKFGNLFMCEIVDVWIKSLGIEVDDKSCDM